MVKKIQKTLAGKEWKVRDSGRRIGLVTVSMGVARFAMSEPQEDLIKRAYVALYKAKRNGRNQIVIQEDTAS